MAALQYLDVLRDLHSELSEWYTSLSDLYQRKLWHHLTLKLEQFVALTVFQAGDALIQLYHNFIKHVDHPLVFYCVRGAIFGAIWIVLGKRIWIFPNILAEEATLGELFRFWPKEDEEERPKWTARLFYTHESSGHVFSPYQIQIDIGI